MCFPHNYSMLCSSLENCAAGEANLKNKHFLCVQYPVYQRKTNNTIL